MSLKDFKKNINKYLEATDIGTDVTAQTKYVTDLASSIIIVGKNRKIKKAKQVVTKVIKERHNNVPQFLIEVEAAFEKYLDETE